MKEGDLIEWIIDGKIFSAVIAIVTDNSFGVYAEYGQDFIPFDKAKKVEV